jgi:hypothetical protein
MNWIELLGWLATITVVSGFILNAYKHHSIAIALWILGDSMWIAYDVVRGIYPHLFLSVVIILINIFGLIKLNK